MAVFGFLYVVTDHGANILLAQCIFAAIYLLNLLVVLKIYSLLCKASFVIDTTL